MRKLLPLMALLLVSTFMSAQTTLFEEYFDNYTAGTTVFSNQPLLFPWTGDAPENGYVSDEQSYSTANSMKIVNSNDMVYEFGAKTSGVFDCNFRMRVAPGQGGYFNVEHAFGTNFAFSMYFKPGGTCDLKQGGTTTTFNYTLDTWMFVELHFDLDQNLASATVDGTEILEWNFLNTESGTGTNNKLDVIDFYGLADATTGVLSSTYYIDDFKFIEAAAGLTPPTISIVTTTIVTDGTAPINHPFSNTGEEVMNFRANPVFTNPSIASTLGNGIMTYDASAVGSFSWASGFAVSAAVRYLPDMTGAHVGQQIVSATIAINEAPLNSEIIVYVWEKGDFIVPQPGNILAQKTFTVTALTENLITFDSPITITGDELWIGYSFTGIANVGTIVTDDQALVPGTSYLKTGPVWGEFDGVSTPTGNFSIRANVEGAGWPAWLAVTPANGTVAAAGNSNITLNFNTTDLTTGTYTATVVVAANDPAQEWSNIPVQLDFVVGIDNVTRIGIMTYPNPATDNINVVSDALINTITVYSVTGQLINSYNVNANSTSIDVTGMAKGNYVIEVKAGNDVVKSNIVVK